MIYEFDGRTKVKLGFDLTDTTKEVMEKQIRYKLADKLKKLNPEGYPKEQITDKDNTMIKYPKIHLLLNYLCENGHSMVYKTDTSGSSVCKACQKNITAEQKKEKGYF